MARKVTVETTIKVVMWVNEGEEVAHVMDEMNYGLKDTTGNATVEDTEMIGYEVKYSV